jgi:ATP-dependent RNA helicase DDX51/DBP6
MADAKLLAARDLHTTRPKVLATLLDCSVDARDGDASFESRLAALKEAMETRPDRRTLVLCSNPSTVDRIVNALGEAPSKNTVVRALHPDVAASERAATIAEFSADDEDSSPTARASASMVLVATDRAVRGLDLPQLEHLTLFDFPRDAVEYLRRVGMATRGSAPPARLTLLAVGRQLSFARALLALDEQGKPLDLDPARR